MDYQVYLTKRGWQSHALGSYMWVDPVDSRRYTTTVALDRQRERDAARLDTALAALELAQAALTDYVEYLTHIGAIEVEEASAALVAVMAAREGKE